MVLTERTRVEIAGVAARLAKAAAVVVSERSISVLICPVVGVAQRRREV